MQKDYMAMAQGQQPKNVQFTKEDVEASEGFTEEELSGLGMPTGTSKEDIKQRLLMSFEKLGLLQMYNTPDKQQQFAALLDELIELFFQKNGQAIQSHPLMQQAAQITEKQQAAPGSDFAGMMPPGGGMNAG